MMKRTRAQFKLALRSCRHHEEQLRCDTLATAYMSNTDTFWKKVKIMTNSGMTQFSCVVGDANTDVSIVKVWKNHYEELYSKHDNNNLVDDKYALRCLNNDYIITVTDVCSAVINLKSGKASGPDGIAAEALKYGGKLLAVHLTLFFNMLVAHCYIPADLTMTSIVPMLKNKAGDATDLNNYRAIALSNSISKLLESVMLNCFQTYDKHEDFYQFGFKRRHSTTDACLVLKSTIDYYRQRGSHVFVNLLDLSKAFDYVNHRLLFAKLVDLEFPCNLTCLLAYWYSNQLMNVRWKAVTSECFLMHNGTRQGSILSPYLFSVYMRSVSKAVANSGIGCHIGNMPCNILMYADDIVLLSPSWHAQQILLDTCAKEICSVAMILNLTKTVTIIYSPYNKSRRVTLSFPPFMLNGIAIAIVNSCKYLGHWLSAEEDDNTDIANQTRLLYARTNFLIRRFSRCSVEVKIRLFKAYCINFYAIALWKLYTVSVFKKLQAAYNKCIKIFFGFERWCSMTVVFAELRLPTLNTVLHNAQHKSRKSAGSHDNALVKYVHIVCNNCLVC